MSLKISSSSLSFVVAKKADFWGQPFKKKESMAALSRVISRVCNKPMAFKILAARISRVLRARAR